MIISYDSLGYHLHFSHQPFLLMVLLGVIVVGSALIGGGWYIYKNFFYDSSAGSQELTDFNPPPPAPQVISQIHTLKARPQLSAGFTVNQAASPAAIKIRVPILMYHYVEYVADKNDKVRIALDTTPATLENEIVTLKNAGYNFLTAEDLADILDGRKALPALPILLTFDDGYRDFYTDAYPILKRYQVKATNYVISGFINRRNHLLTSQLQEIARDGLVEIGAHTVNHVGLARLSSAKVANEVFQSKIQLQNLIGKDVVSFAYPFGSFDLAVAKIVETASFRTAVSTLPGVSAGLENRYYLFRLRPNGRTGQAFLNYLSQPSYNNY